MSGSPELMSEIPYASASVTSHEILIEGFKKDCVIRGMAAGSIPRYLSVINIFCKFLDERGLNLFRVERDVLRDFLEYLKLERNACHKTVENYFTVLSSLFEYFTYEGYGDKSSFAGEEEISKKI
jgi:hypothetical protein